MSDRRHDPFQRRDAYVPACSVCLVASGLRTALAASQTARVAAEVDRERAVQERDEWKAKAEAEHQAHELEKRAHERTWDHKKRLIEERDRAVQELKAAESSFGHCSHGHSGVALIRWSPAPNEHVIACPQCLVVERDEWKRNAEMATEALKIQQRTESAAVRLADAHRGEEKPAGYKVTTADGFSYVQKHKPKEEFLGVVTPLYEHPAPSPSSRAEEPYVPKDYPALRAAAIKAVDAMDNAGLPGKWTVHVTKEGKGILFRDPAWIAKDVVVRYDAGCAPSDLTAEIAKLKAERTDLTTCLDEARKLVNADEWDTLRTMYREALEKERAEVASLRAQLDGTRREKVATGYLIRRDGKIWRHEKVRGAARTIFKRLREQDQGGHVWSLVRLVKPKPAGQK